MNSEKPLSYSISGFGLGIMGIVLVGETIVCALEDYVLDHEHPTLNVAYTSSIVPIPRSVEPHLTPQNVGLAGMVLALGGAYCCSVKRPKN